MNEKFEDSEQYCHMKAEAEREGKKLCCLPIGDREYIGREVKRVPAEALMQMMIEMISLSKEIRWVKEAIKEEMASRVRAGKADGTEVVVPATSPFTTGDAVKDAIHAILAGGDLETAELKGDA